MSKKTNQIGAGLMGCGCLLMLLPVVLVLLLVFLGVITSIMQ